MNFLFYCALAADASETWRDLALAEMPVSRRDHRRLLQSELTPTVATYKRVFDCTAELTPYLINMQPSATVASFTPRNCGGTRLFLSTSWRIIT